MNICPLLPTVTHQVWFKPECEETLWNGLEKGKVVIDKQVKDT